MDGRHFKTGVKGLLSFQKKQGPLVAHMADDTDENGENLPQELHSDTVREKSPRHIYV